MHVQILKETVYKYIFIFNISQLLLCIILSALITPHGVSEIEM